MVREYLDEHPGAPPRQVVAYVWQETPAVGEMVSAMRAAPNDAAALAVLVDYFTDPARDIPSPDTLTRRAREVRRGGSRLSGYPILQGHALMPLQGSKKASEARYERRASRVQGNKRASGQAQIFERARR